MRLVLGLLYSLVLLVHFTIRSNYKILTISVCEILCDTMSRVTQAVRVNLLSSMQVLCQKQRMAPSPAELQEARQDLQIVVLRAEATADGQAKNALLVVADKTVEWIDTAVKGDRGCSSLSLTLQESASADSICCCETCYSARQQGVSYPADEN